MKKLLAVCLILSCVILQSVFAADYYVANNGNDNYDGSLSSPWQTIAKVNNRSFQPGDKIHFRCGDTWREQLNVSSSGAANNPITFTSYGDCNSNNKPVINASEAVTGWSQYSGNIYVADIDLSNKLNNLVYNGNFSSDISGWSASSDSSISHEQSCGLGTGCLKFVSSPTSTQNYVNSGNYVVIKERTLYSLSVRLRAGGNETLNVRIRLQQSWDTERKHIVYDKVYTVGPNGIDVLDFFTHYNRKDYALIYFDLENQNGKTLYIDDVIVKPSANQLFVDGQYLKLAQHPNVPNVRNTNYLTIDEASSNNYLVDSELANYQNPNSLSLPTACGSDLAGAGVHIRNYAWYIDDTVVDSFDISNNRLNFNNPTVYSMPQGYGYYLDNKLCFLDSHGEWYYDTTYKKLYVWLPDGTNPSNHIIEASTYDSGVKLYKNNYIVIDGLQIKHAMLSNVEIMESTNFMLTNLNVIDSGGEGMYVVYSSTGSIENSTVSSNVTDGIQLKGSSAVHVIGNNIANTNVIGSPKLSEAAIFVDHCNKDYWSFFGSCNNMQIKNNTIANSGYMGIAVYGRDVTVQNNVVDNSCLVLDDCGAIYTWNGNNTNVANNISIVGNIVTDIIGNSDGTPNSMLLSEGIYLDDGSNSITISGNTVVRASQYGIFLHNAFSSAVDNNTLYGNKDYQFAVTEGNDSKYIRTIRNNAVTKNIMFPINQVPSIYVRYNDYAYTFFQATVQGNCGIGFNCNTYSLLYSDKIVYERNYEATTSANYDLPSWQAIRKNDYDSKLFAPFSVSSYRIASVLSNNYITNSAFDTGVAGWDLFSYEYANTPDPNDSAYDYAFITYETNPSICNRCLKFEAGPITYSYNPSFASSNHFSLQKDKTYFVEFKLSSAQNLDVEVVVERHGGNYANLGLIKVIPANTSWGYHQFIFIATEDDSNARVNFRVATSNAVIYLDDVKLYEVTVEYNDTTDDSHILINKTSTTQNMECPEKDSNPTKCNQYVYIDSNDTDQDGEITEKVTWPMALAPYSSKIIVWSNNPFGSCTDSDGDGFYKEGGTCGPIDCNDNNPAVNPGAAEICDGVDNDCDGQVDEGFDADNDGIADCFDNCRNVANPDQRDSNAGEDDNTTKAGIQHYGDVCDPDFNNDGIVGLADINELRKYYGKSVPPAPASVDLDGNGVIGLSDINILRKYYGKTPGPGVGD
ncbi:MAG: right-handed parallel beta-helix repeat-containing protein [Nitrospirae bacterium]|nr:right-handed parallel beta-helix repeat-containing protein [Nitrospirota bacterium]